MLKINIKKLSISGITLIIIALFLGTTLTGMIVYKTDYEDLCKTDADCKGEGCCLIYEDKPVGICMENCQSYEFLCTKSKECEEGTVCCISEGMDYGICNTEEKCLSIDIYAEYVKKSTNEKIQPAPDNTTRIIWYQAVAILILTIVIIYLLTKKRK